MSPKSASAASGERVLDRTDRRLLARLQQDGRAAVSQLAREVHLTVTPTLERVRRLESAGYIEGYFARLSPGRLGLGLLAYVEVLLDRTTPDAFERFKQVMLAHDEVMECHMVAGGFDYLLKVRVTDMESYRRFRKENMPRCVAMNPKSRCGQCCRSCFTTSWRRLWIRWRMAASSACQLVRSVGSASIPCTIAAP
ncbi:MAG: winged helix-turn-helix transcriptional regulator [Gammaproteobacteria bacterium]|nr:MAG: winged helix-turn-helix transcriptional regulator [Gammaproteobacteria bacterium]